MLEIEETTRSGIRSFYARTTSTPAQTSALFLSYLTAVGAIFFVLVAYSLLIEPRIETALLQHHLFTLHKYAAPATYCLFFFHIIKTTFLGLHCLAAKYIAVRG